MCAHAERAARRHEATKQAHEAHCGSLHLTAPGGKNAKPSAAKQSSKSGRSRPAGKDAAAKKQGAAASAKKRKKKLDPWDDDEEEEAADEYEEDEEDEGDDSESTSEGEDESESEDDHDVVGVQLPDLPTRAGAAAGGSVDDAECTGHIGGRSDEQPTAAAGAEHVLAGSELPGLVRLGAAV